MPIDLVMHGDQDVESITWFPWVKQNFHLVSGANIMDSVHAHGLWYLVPRESTSLRDPVKRVRSCGSR